MEESGSAASVDTGHALLGCDQGWNESVLLQKISKANPFPVVKLVRQWAVFLVHDCKPDYPDHLCYGCISKKRRKREFCILASVLQEHMIDIDFPATLSLPLKVLGSWKTLPFSKY